MAMRTIGYRPDGKLTCFGRHWHLSDGKLLWLRYGLGRIVERAIGYDPAHQPMICRWLGLSGYQHLIGEEMIDG